MKAVFRGLLIAVVVLMVGGCTALVNLVTPPDLRVISVIPDDTGAKGLASVSVTFASVGGGLNGVAYALVLSNGTSLSYFSDVIAYEGTVDIPAFDSVEVTIPRSEIDTYMTDNGETAADGSYYVGVILDPLDRVADAITTAGNGQDVSDGEFAFSN